MARGEHQRGLITIKSATKTKRKFSHITGTRSPLPLIPISILPADRALHNFCGRPTCRRGESLLKKCCGY